MNNIELLLLFIQKIISDDGNVTFATVACDMSS